jgi:hypothetical protein
MQSKLKTFKSLDTLLDYFNNLPISNDRITDGRGTYQELYDESRGRMESHINERDEDWYGKPLPTSYQDALDRNRYQLMDEFNEIYLQNIKPRLQEIIKDSKADLQLPVYKYNDLGLGLFDFNKASTGLIPKYQYYSFKKKEIVEGNQVDTVKDGDKFVYVLKSDKSPCVLVPFILSDDKKLLQKVYKEIYDGEDVFVVLKKYNLRIGGSGAFGSTIKKSYILKENTLKPKNAVRIFIKLGQNCGVTAEQYKWAGYAAIGVAQLLSLLGGYAVNIIGVLGNRTNININQDGNLVEGYRFWGINLKPFEETLDAKSLLYVASDATFFRIKVFDYMVKQAGFYKDYYDSGLGSMADVRTVEDMIFKEYGKRDKLFLPNGDRNIKSQFLYYTIGDIYSLDEMNTAILEIGLDVVNKNREAKEKLLGY